jgi:hypothetical protein
MTTRTRTVDLNIEKKLAELNLTPSQHARALDALQTAEDMVDFLESVGAVVKRIAGVFSLKPSMRA